MQAVLDWFALTSRWELLAVVLALLYVVLAVKKSLWCWLAAIISSAIYVVLMTESRLYMEAALNVFYIVMAIYGYWEWTRRRDTTGEVLVVRWPLSSHFSGMLLTAALTIANGWWLAAHTDASRPYWDSFITWSSVFATWMVARRVAENWIYWIAIDAIAAVLYFQVNRKPTAILFVVYVLISVQGLREWLRSSKPIERSVSIPP